MSPLRRHHTDRRWETNPGTGLILPRRPSRERFIQPRGTSQCCCGGGSGWGDICNAVCLCSYDLTITGLTDVSGTCRGSELNGTWEGLIGVGSSADTDSNGVAYCYTILTNTGTAALCTYSVMLILYASLEAQTRAVLVRSRKSGGVGCTGCIFAECDIDDIGVLYGISPVVTDCTTWESADGPYGWDGAGSVSPSYNCSVGASGPGEATVSWTPS